MNRGRNGKKDVRLFLRPGKPEKANNLIINSLWIVFYVEWHQLKSSNLPETHRFAQPDHTKLLRYDLGWQRAEAGQLE